MITSLPTHVFRVTKSTFTTSTSIALSGLGGVYDGGRWHTKGQRIVYTAADSSGCLLERMVHGDEWIADRHPDRVMLTITMPRVSTTYYTADEISKADPHWKKEGNATCVGLGDRWLAAGDHCALIIPSAANPHSANILLNPAHTDFSEIIAANDPLVSAPVDLDDRVVMLVRKVASTT